jgi:phospholipid/cholesterol/gamma-HCH transport system substrate-binding protein
MNPKVSYTLVGLFVLVFGTALVTIGVWLSASTSGTEYITYVAYFTESVSGLNPNATVSYRGVDVGKVSEIELDPDDPSRVRVLLEIEKGTPVKEDTVAILVSQGITGLSNVELSGGSRQSPMLEARPGELYPEIETGASLFVRLDRSVTNLVDSLTETTNMLQGVAERVELLLGDENQRSITRILRGVADITDAVATHGEQLSESLDDVAIILGNTAAASEQLPRVMAQLNDTVASLELTLNGAIERVAGGIEETTSSFTTVAETVNTTVDNVNTMVLDTQRDLAAFTQNTPRQVDQLVAELRSLSETLRILSQDLERDPNMLVFGRPHAQTGPGE